MGGGEGGLILTNDKGLYERASQFAESGGFWRPDRFAPPRWDGELFCGSNYRMSELEAAVDLVQLRKMPTLVRQYNRNKRSILNQLKTYREITPQRINDLEGEVGSTLRFYPETIELGKRIADALNAEGIGCGNFIFPVECAVRDEAAPPDWHVYYDMFPIVLKTCATKEGCPFSCPIYKDRGGKIEYNKGDCPVADDLFNRQVAIWLDPWYSQEDCLNIANGINKVLSAYCIEDPFAAKWA
jgi:dTDP-4-amino-4,6-dideoxygalactose transaminase